MLFTAAGLEQATRLSVAAHHARRYRDAGSTRVADLTCGIGADAMAFAGIGLRVLATDVDEATAAIATVNLRHFPDAEVRHGDGLALDLEAEGIDGVYADPARRTSSGSRVFDPSAYEPSLDAVLAVRDRVPALGLKLGPGIPHTALPADAQAQWVSVDGDVVEVGLWFGPLAPEGPGRSALVLRDGEAHVVQQTSEERPPTGALGSYLYEPDGAVIRAGLVGETAAQVHGRLVDADHRLRHVRRPHAVPTADRLPGARLHAVRPQAAPDVPARARRGEADDQEARYRGGAGAAATPARPAGQRDGDDHPHPRGGQPAGARGGAGLMATPVTVPFGHSERSTVGIEWEVALVDADSGDLRQAAEAILAAVRPAGGGEHPLITQELLLNTVEIRSGKCRTVAEADGRPAARARRGRVRGDAPAHRAHGRRRRTRSPTGRSRRSPTSSGTPRSSTAPSGGAGRC